MSRVTSYEYNDMLYWFIIEQQKLNKDRLIELYNSFIYFGVIGLINLCVKGDNNGFYSIGDSMNICELLEIIKADVKDTDYYDILYESNNEFPTVYEIFEESYSNKKLVTIT